MTAVQVFIVYFVLRHITEFKQRVPCFDVLTGSVYSRALSGEATYVSALAYIVTVVRLPEAETSQAYPLPDDARVAAHSPIILRATVAQQGTTTKILLLFAQNALHT